MAKLVNIVSKNKYLQNALESIEDLAQYYLFSTAPQPDLMADLNIIYRDEYSEDVGSIPCIIVDRPLKLRELIDVMNKALDGEDGTIRLNDFVIFNYKKRSLKVSDLQVSLTEIESAILYQIWIAGSFGANKDGLMQQVMGYAGNVESNALEAHIYRLRSKIMDAGGGIGIAKHDGAYTITT